MEVLQQKPERISNEIKRNAEQKRRGKLKIFFGYASGIGKTYAMLSSALQEIEAGVDLIAGCMEAQAGTDTAAMKNKVKILPPIEMRENGLLCKEFDLDAALERKPDTILIDEMAHTNSSGCRHTKRYEDIEELLNAGINVYTTLNVQHIESLHDIVAGITGAAVKERVPDAAFDRSDQIEMIDFSPEELIVRLKEGKICCMDNMQNALQHFFTLDKLAALREIALRRMADWVNARQDDYMAEPKPADPSEHIMMCLSSSPSNATVIRQAARMANAFHGKFTAFYVEDPYFLELNKDDEGRLQENTRMAEQLGANIMISYGNDIVEQIAEYAKAARVTKIVLGRTYTTRSLFYIKESFSERLLKIAPHLEIFLIPDAHDKTYRKKKNSTRITPIYLMSDTAITALLLTAATVIGMFFQNAGLRSDNLIMVYMIGALITALTATHRISSIIYGIATIFVFNYFFTEPLKSFRVNDPGYIVTFGVMLTTSLIITTLARVVRQSAKQAAEKSYRTEILLETSRKLQQATAAEGIAAQSAEQLGKLLNCRIYCFVGRPQADSGPLVYVGEEEEETALSKEEIAVAQWVYNNNKHAGATTTTLPGSKCLYLAVRNGDKIFAIIGVELKEKNLTVFEKSVMLAMLNESALAFEKEEMVRKEKETALRLKQEQLHTNILRSISHDLRTPLTSISGNADMLMRSAEQMEIAERDKKYTDIYEDSIWLINLVENLLSVTRIENGAMEIHMQAELVDDIVTESIKHMKRHACNHAIRIEQKDDMLVGRMDAKLIIQVITNLIDNAVKYTIPDSDILLHIRQKKDMIIFEVADHGFGVPEGQKEKVFSLFYTGENVNADGRRGMGMGLSLCKSIVEAHGGTIWVRDNEPTGAIFGFSIKAEEVNLL